MLTASGDQSVALWDTLSARRVSAFHGHAGSVKSVCPMPTCHDVFASGAHAARSGPPFLCRARAACVGGYMLPVSPSTGPSLHQTLKAHGCSA